MTAASCANSGLGGAGGYASPDAWRVFAQPKWWMAGDTTVLAGHELLVRPQAHSHDAEGFYVGLKELSCSDRSTIELAALHRAIRAASEMPGHVSINITGFLLARPESQWLLRGLATAGMRERVTVELVEHDPLRLATMENALIDLADAGIRIALDDYGKGYACLSVVVCLPMISELKIADTYLRTERGQKLLPHVIEAAHKVGMDSTVECIDSEALFLDCKNAGARYGQGNWLAAARAID